MAHDKNQKLLLDGVLALSQKMLSAGVKKKKRKWFLQSGRNMSFQKKKTTKVENTRSVTVIPRLYYLSALTCPSEMASCFIQGILE